MIITSSARAALIFVTVFFAFSAAIVDNRVTNPLSTSTWIGRQLIWLEFQIKWIERRFWLSPIPYTHLQMKLYLACQMKSADLPVSIDPDHHFAHHHILF